VSTREWIMVIGATILQACFVAFVVWGVGSLS
jgi:hypothetical protein